MEGDDRFRRIASGSGWCEPSELPKGPNGRPLCRRCDNETTPPRRTFCSDACVHEWKIRTQPEYAKAQVLKRDRGICARCGTDTLAKLKERLALQHQAFNVEDARHARRARSYFDMDHIVPVVEGGGACGLENLRTLCRPCHKLETAELAKRRAERRRQAAG